MSHTFEAIPLIFVIGATNAGKSTLLDAVRPWPGVGMVEVGKMFRAKYPPEYFAGQANPSHTQVEAWQMFLDAVSARALEGCHVAFVDGQPRDLEQCEAILALPNPKVVLHLWAPTSERKRRAVSRDGLPDVPDELNAKLQLSLSRVTGDLPKLYDVVMRIQSDDTCTVHHLDTTSHNYSPSGVTRALVHDLVTGCLRPRYSPGNRHGA